MIYTYFDYHILCQIVQENIPKIQGILSSIKPCLTLSKQQLTVNKGVKKISHFSFIVGGLGRTTKEKKYISSRSWKLKCFQLERLEHGALYSKLTLRNMQFHDFSLEDAYSVALCILIYTYCPSDFNSYLAVPQNRFSLIQPIFFKHFL